MSTLMRTFIKATPKEGTPAWFSNYPLIIGVGVLTLTIPVAYFGYWLLKKKGWQLAVLTSPLIVSQAIALSYVLHLLNLFTAEFIVINQVLLATLSSAFLFPVLQIGYLSFTKNKPFFYQSVGRNHHRPSDCWVWIVHCPIVVNSLWHSEGRNCLLTTDYHWSCHCDVYDDRNHWKTEASVPSKRFFAPNLNSSIHPL